MSQEDFAATAPERQQIWTLRTINTNRKNVFPFNQQHGIEETTPIGYELVLMNKHTELRYWIARHPEDIEITHRQKTPLLVAIKYNSYNCFKILIENKQT